MLEPDTGYRTAMCEIVKEKDYYQDEHTTGRNVQFWEKQDF